MTSIFKRLEEIAMKPLRWLLMLALVVVPLSGASAGCEAEVDEDGGRLDVGD